MEDSQPIFFCKRFSYNENALYFRAVVLNYKERAVGRLQAAWRSAQLCSHMSAHAEHHAEGSVG